MHLFLMYWNSKQAFLRWLSLENIVGMFLLTGFNFNTVLCVMSPELMLILF